MNKRSFTIRHLNPTSRRYTACGVTSNRLRGVLQLREDRKMAYRLPTAIERYHNDIANLERRYTEQMVNSYTDRERLAAIRERCDAITSAVRALDVAYC